jgi:hypothetical protein
MILSPEAFAAYDVLFGAGASVPDLPRERLLAAARTAFKRRAHATHPDRAHTLGRPVAELTAEFVRIRSAYEDLVAALEAPPPCPAPPPRRPSHPPVTSARTPRATAARTTTSRTMPRRALRFAEYLYHRGLVPWRAVVRAVEWQRAQRPRLGELAVRFGYLTQAQVDGLLVSRAALGRAHVPLGELACERGLLTARQRATLLSHQRRRQPPIGAYFVAHGLLRERQLKALLAEHAAHQRRYGQGRAQGVEPF